MKLMVYVAPRSKVVHISDTCTKLRGTTTEQISLADSKPRRLCQICMSDAPQHPRYLRPFCVTCGGRRPCRHNGGVAWTEVQTVSKSRGTLRAGDRVTKTRWVWPDSPVLLANHLHSVVE